jgi:hypothetical protein
MIEIMCTQPLTRRDHGRVRLLHIDIYSSHCYYPGRRDRTLRGTRWAGATQANPITDTHPERSAS